MYGTFYQKVGVKFITITIDDHLWLQTVLRDSECTMGMFSDLPLCIFKFMQLDFTFLSAINHQTDQRINQSLNPWFYIYEFLKHDSYKIKYVYYIINWIRNIFSRTADDRTGEEGFTQRHGW